MDIKSVLELDNRLTKGMGVAEKPGLLRAIAVFFAHSGDSWFWLVALIVLWLLGNAFWRQWAVVVLGSISALVLLVFPLKRLIRRRRPEGLWGLIYRRTDPHSFPSGHAARAFLIAVLASGLGPGWLPPILWVWAPLVAVARVAMGVHYLSDILGGLMLGIMAGLLVLHFLPLILTLLTSFLPWLF